MMKTPNLSAKLRALSARIDGRTQRERLLLCGAAAALAFLLIDALLFGPALKTWQTSLQQRQEAQASIARLQAESVQRLAQAALKQRQEQSELVTWRQRVRDGEAQLRSFEATLIGPDQMLPVLDRMLASHGALKLRAMVPLGRTDLLADASGQATTAATPSPASSLAAAPSTSAKGKTKASSLALATPVAPAVPVASNTDSPTPSLYRHGLQITVEGSFADLLTYVQALEAMPQRVLWGDVAFKVEHYPRAALTLQLYTISRDRHWLEI